MTSNDKLFEICNFNLKNMPSDDTYNSFNNFIFSSDIKLLGKLLYRFRFFEQVQHLPGDFVEIGVFKGSGMATFLKFIEIFAPNSNKKVIGFDIFSPSNSQKILEKDGSFDKEKMNIVYSKVQENELSVQSVSSRLDKISDTKKYILIEGDVQDTLPIFLKDNPGFRVSLIYIDVDLERPTYAALINLWDRLLPGGVILFDEFEYHKFSESSGVEKFLKEKNLEFNIESTNWIAPTAFIVKKSF